MSFIYAEKINGTLNIHCDTRIGLGKNASASFSREQLELIPTYGIVKTTLICPEISVSFAGNNIFLASELFSQLNKKKDVYYTRSY